MALTQVTRAAPAVRSQLVLRFGSRGPAVSDLQARLAARGFPPGPVDGAFGPKTQAAVKAFQAANGLVADGIVGAKTWARLAAAPAQGPQPAGAISLGARGEQVRGIQQQLARQGFNPGPVDGIFGPMTQAAVKRLQGAAGLPATGVVDARTQAALKSGDVFVPSTPPAPAPSGPVRDRIVAIAQAELARGVREDAGEDRDRAGRIVEYRRAVTGPGENPNAAEPWCADFASWVSRQAGAPIGVNGQGQDYVPFLRDWASSAGRYHQKSGYTPRPGDLVLFSYGGVRPDHVAVVTRVENGRVHTIGGNESDSVKASSYELSRGSILGYVTPAGG